MTAKKLYETLKFLVGLDDQLRLQSGLEAIRDTLNNLVNQPAQPQHQSALANGLDQFSKSAASLAEAITPSQASTISEMGGKEFFDPEIADKVRSSISKNAMTPSVARDFVNDLAARRAGFLGTVRSTIQGLEKLNIKQEAPAAGSADFAFLIPRSLFENQLGEFAKELKFISRLLQHISEGLTGEIQPVELENLSSSIPTIGLAAGVGVIATLATIVNKFLEAWERILKIRKIRDELSEIGMKGTALEELNQQVTTTIDEIVAESTSIVMIHYNGSDSARKNELENAVRTDVRRLFGQIERGLTVEFHAEPKKDGSAEDNKAIDTVIELSRQIKFPDAATSPLLLTSNEILEGEIYSKTTKKTTHKTSTTKKETPKPSTD